MKFSKEKMLKRSTINIEVPKNEVLDLDGIQECKDTIIININIQKFDYKSRYRLKNVELLKELPNIKKLRITDTFIHDLTFIKDMKNLTEVNFSSTDVRDISVLKDKALTSLWLYGTKVSDISCMSDFEYKNKLQYISLLDSLVEDLTPLRDFNIDEIIVGNITKKVDGYEWINYIEIPDTLMSGLTKLKNLTMVNFKKSNEMLYNWKLEKLISGL